MRITGQFVRVALASLTVLPTLISALTTAQKDVLSREYASTVTKNNIIQFFGGSSTRLDVLYLDATTGLDANSPTWNWWNQPTNSDFKAFTRGVAFSGSNDDIYLQGGMGTTTLLEDLVVFSNNYWRKAVTTGVHPASALMTASLNPSDNSVYYYGGRLLKNHQLDAIADSINTFYKFDINNGAWSALNPATNGIERPGRTAHTSNLINNQVFIMGGVSDFKNNSKAGPSADFASVLVYDISSNTAISVTTLGDIPPARNSYSTALGLDGRSIVIYGGILVGGKDENKAASSDLYVLDTCSLTWRKQSTKGSAPGSLNSHNAININNYMVLALGKTNDKDYNFNIAILDMDQWKWVNSFTETKDTIQPASCKFELPSVNATTLSPMNYDESVMVNPLTPVKKKVDSKGFGIGFGILAVVLIAAGAYFYVKRVRNKKSRTLNPRWMRSAPTHTNSGYSNDRDYPLFVYNKELDSNNINNPNIPRSQAANGVRTYTASDHEQWEQQLNEDAASPNGVTSSRNSDIWNRMRGLNDASVISDEEVQRNRTNNGRLVDL